MPQNPKANLDEDGSIAVSFDAVEGAKSYLVHYGNANEDDPHDATMMGYTEKTSWSLSADNVPAHDSGDKLYLFVQAYFDKGVGDNDIDKARYLHDGEFTGSEWSAATTITF